MEKQKAFKRNTNTVYTTSSNKCHVKLIPKYSVIANTFYYLISFEKHNCIKPVIEYFYV